MQRKSLANCQAYFDDIEGAREPKISGRGSSQDLTARVGPPSFLKPSTSFKMIQRELIKLEPAIGDGYKAATKLKTLFSGPMSTTSLGAHTQFNRRPSSTREQSPSKPILLKNNPNLFSRKNTKDDQGSETKLTTPTQPRV
jgi:hypothetical protein